MIPLLLNSLPASAEWAMRPSEARNMIMILAFVRSMPWVDTLTLLLSVLTGACSLSSVIWRRRLSRVSSAQCGVLELHCGSAYDPRQKPALYPFNSRTSLRSSLNQHPTLDSAPASSLREAARASLLSLTASENFHLPAAWVFGPLLPSSIKSPCLFPLPLPPSPG